MASGAVIARIISQYSDKGSKQAQKDIAKLGKQFDAFGRRAAKSFGLATVAAAGFAAKLAKDAVQGAMEDQKQQQALAVALRNTTGATEAAIEANQRYLDGLELQVAIDNKELIPALQKLVTATGNLKQAQDLLSLATDVSAASGKDLGTVTTALSRAVRGNFTALTKLGLPLDQNAIKAKDFLAVQKDLAQISKGQAAAAANTFAGKLETLRLRFQQVSERVGYALIPVLEKLVDRIEKDIFPAFDKFIRTNQNDIVNAFQTSIKLIESFTTAMVTLGNVIAKYETLFKILASGILTVLGYIKLFAAAQALKGFLQYLVSANKLFRAEFAMMGPQLAKVSNEFVVMGFQVGKLGREMRGFKEAAKLSQKFKILGRAIFLSMSPALILFAKIAVAIGVIYAAYRGLKWLLEKFAKDDRKREAQKKIALQKEADAANALAATYDSLEVRKQKAFERNKAQQDVILAGFKQIEEQVAAANKQAKIDAEAAARNARLAKEQAADEAKRLYIKGLEAKAAAKLRTLNRNLLTDEKKMAVQLAAIKKQNAKLDKEGIKLTDPDEMTAIQMEAIYQNLVKGGKILLAEVTKQQKAADDLKIKAAEEYNKLLERQRDILQALAGDNKVTQEEIGLLAKQWEMTSEAAQAYVQEILAIGDQKIDDTEVRNLALMWYGNTSESATSAVRKYLDFLNEVNKGNGTISNEGVKRLAQTWYGGQDNAEDAVRKYEKAVIAISDGKIDKAEITALKDAWNVSEQAVIDYLLEVGKPFTLTDDAKTILDAATIAKVALAWDAAYLALKRYLDLAKGAAGNASVVPVVPKNPTNPITPVIPTTPGGKPEVQIPDGNMPSAQAAIVYAVAKAAGDMETAAKAAAQVTPTVLAAAESGAIGAASIAAQLKAAEERVAYAATLAGFKEKEAREAAAAATTPVSDAAADAAERARFRAMIGTSSAASSIGGGNLMAAPVVNITVQGSVTAEQDLVTAVRNGLLATQYNGNQLLLEAI